VQPAAIVAGLARAVLRRGVTIVERTRALRVQPGRVETDRGTVRAETVLVATEAYTQALSGHARRVLPVISRVLATEPLPPEVWQRVGWHGRVTVADSRSRMAAHASCCCIAASAAEASAPVAGMPGTLQRRPVSERLRWSSAGWHG